MNAKNAKLLRYGAKKYGLPYKKLKQAFSRLSEDQRSIFLSTARRGIKL